MNELLVALDFACGVIFTVHAFCAIAPMHRATRHVLRLVYITLAVGAVGMFFSPAMDAEWRRYSHIAVIVALALLVIVDQRKRVDEPRRSGISLGS